MNSDIGVEYPHHIMASMDNTLSACRLATQSEALSLGKCLGPWQPTANTCRRLSFQQSNVSDNCPVVELQSHGQGTGNEGSIQSGRVLDDCITVRMRCWCHRAACKAAGERLHRGMFKLIKNTFDWSPGSQTHALLRMVVPGACFWDKQVIL